MATPWYNYGITESYTNNVEWGNDIGVPLHTPITNLYGGYVTDARCGLGWGCQVGIQTNVPGYGNLIEYFQHLDTTAVQVGQYVTPGQLVGLSGGQTSGGYNPNNPKYSSGPHVEFGFGAPWVGGASGCTWGSACNPNSLFAIQAAQAGKVGQPPSSSGGGGSAPGHGPAGSPGSPGSSGPGYGQQPGEPGPTTGGSQPGGGVPGMPPGGTTIGSNQPPQGSSACSALLAPIYGLIPGAKPPPMIGATIGSAGMCDICNPSSYMVCLANAFGVTSVEDMFIRAGLIILGLILVIVGFSQLFKDGTSVNIQPTQASTTQRSARASEATEAAEVASV